MKMRGSQSLLREKRVPVASSPGSKRGILVAARASSSPALDALREEKEVLLSTIEEASSQIKALEAKLKSRGVIIPPFRSKRQPMQGPLPEDFWSPTIVLPAEYDTGFVEPYGSISPIPAHNGTDCFKWDDYLWDSAEHFKYRWNRFRGVKNAIDQNEGGMMKFTEGYKHYGINRGEHEGRKGLWYREWAPGAKALCLVGDFNSWSPKPEHWAVKNQFGVWSLFLPNNANGTSAIPHRTKIKTRLESADGTWAERIPAWVKWATQEWNEIQFNGVHWDPEEKGAPGEIVALGGKDKTYTFKYPRPPKPRSLKIYECHVGMSSQEPKINSYLEFKRDMLPRIRKLGYNCIQIMAIQEHAYYGSFGYHVTNFFAVSSRCGTPEELKAMIDEAHRLGIVVLMDIVHSHASKNTADGISMFDGTDSMYFHSGERGNHWMWDSRCFNYGNWETMRFLLSNARWWIDEYKFDGYRFDGVTSMMYNHHGLNYTFTGNYNEYFGMNTDVDAVVYLMLVNNMIHDLFPTCITIGEDVSGMPSFCRPWQEGGIGFDYRLQMAIADKWISILKSSSDFDWSMGDIVHTLTNRRYNEGCVGYAESHDQALVGDKTIAFWLMDAAMYNCMASPGNGPQSPVVDRGIALHKLIRLVTCALGGESYLNFMGNEFGHPEWIDFPRVDTHDTSTGRFIPGNGGSLDKCRRRWDLEDDVKLRYKSMSVFDRAMIHLEKAFGFLSAPHQFVSKQDEGDKLIIVERGDLIFVFNFHPTNSYTDYKIGCKLPGDYQVVLSSDEEVFGGYRNVTKDSAVTFAANQGLHDNRPYHFYVYSPSRTVVCYAPAEFCDPNADKKPHGIEGLGVRDLGPYFSR